MQKPIDEDLLLLALAPADSWARTSRPVIRRQWRTLKNEAPPTAPPPAADGAAASSAATDDNEAFESGDRHIGMASFTIGDVLGEGNYSQIMAVTMRATQERYALKVVDKDKVKRNKKTTDVLVEKWVLRHVEHPSIIKLFHTFQDRGALYLVLELVAGGELWAITHRRGLFYSWASFYTAQLLEVLQYLHGLDIVHRDLKPENVMLTPDGRAKLIDFGTAKLIGRPPPRYGGDSGGKFKEFVGTPEYMAPEMINNEDADYRADLWSLGCVVTQLLAGWPPFKGARDRRACAASAACACAADPHRATPQHPDLTPLNLPAPQAAPSTSRSSASSPGGTSCRPASRPPPPTSSPASWC